MKNRIIPVGMKRSRDKGNRSEKTKWKPSWFIAMTGNTTGKKSTPFSPPCVPQNMNWPY